MPGRVVTEPRNSAVVSHPLATQYAGLNPGFGFGGGQVERRRRKDRGAEGGVYRGGVSPPPQTIFSFLGLKMRILVRSPAHLECLFLHYNTSRSRPALLLPTLTFQADCGSIKGAGAGVSAEEGTEHYLPW